MIDNVRLIQHGSLNTKRQVVILLAQDADGESVTEVVKRLADPACWEALNEAIEPLVLHAEEEDLNATIAMLAKDENFAAEYGKNSLYEALKLLAQHAIAKQLHAAILALLATSEQLEAIIEACSEEDDY